MILGGLFFVYKGILKIDNVANEGALNAEVLRLIKVQTQVPGLGFFIVGILCLGIAVQFSKQDVVPILVEGEVDGVEGEWQASIQFYPIEHKGWNRGKFGRKYLPDYTTLQVKINAPGYLPYVSNVHVDSLQGYKAAFGTARLEKALDKSDLIPEIAAAKNSSIAKASFGGVQ